MKAKLFGFNASLSSLALVGLLAQFGFAVATTEPTIKITEILYDAAGSDSGKEWVEITNLGAGPATITTGSSKSAWRFFDTANHTLSLIQGDDSLAPGESAILASDPTAFLGTYSFAGSVFKSALSLPNSNATLKLSADGGTTWLTEQAYSNSAGAAGDGRTLEWVEGAWQVSHDVGGTPGVYPPLASPDPEPSPSTTTTPAAEPSPSPSPIPSSPGSPEPTSSPSPSATTPTESEPSPLDPPSTPDIRLFISEIYYDAPGGDSDKEWIEVRNDSPAAVRILPGRSGKSWRLIVGTRRHTLTIHQGNNVIAAGERFVIVQDASAFLTSYPDYRGTVVRASFSLPNKEGNLALSLDGGATTIAAVSYQASDGGAGSGSSLEREEEAPWREGGLGGSPGAAFQPPAQLPAVGGSDSSEAPTPTGPGSSMPLPLPRLTFSEIFYNPHGSDENREWIELQNTGSIPIQLNLENWRLRVNTRAHRLELVAGPPSLYPGDFLLLTRPGYQEQVSDLTAARATAAFSLNNSGAALAISFDKGATWIDQFDYRKEDGAAGDGRSLERAADGSWRTSPLLGGTPGGAPREPAVHPIPKLFISELSPEEEWIEICSNDSALVDFGGWQLDDRLRKGSPAYRFDPGTLAPGTCRLFARTDTGLILGQDDEVHLLNPEGQAVDSVYYQAAPADSVWVKGVSGETYWSLEASPGEPNHHRQQPLVESAKPDGSTGLAPLYLPELGLIIDQTTPVFRPLTDLPITSGWHIQTSGRVQRSLAKSALIQEPSGQSLRIRFRLPTGAKPKIQRGDTIDVSGQLIYQGGEPELEVSDPSRITVVRPARNPRSNPPERVTTVAPAAPVQLSSAPPAPVVALPPINPPQYRQKTGYSTWTIGLPTGMIGVLILSLSLIGLRIIRDHDEEDYHLAPA